MLQKELSLLDRYKIIPSPDGAYYFFTTDLNIEYRIVLLHQDLAGLSALNFSFYCVPETNGGDIKVRNTIIYFVKRIIIDQDNIIVFSCDANDKKHHCRNRKFNGWFTHENLSNNLGLEKHDSSNIVVDDITYFASLIISEADPLRQNYIDAFISETDPSTYNK